MSTCRACLCALLLLAALCAGCHGSSHPAADTGTTPALATDRTPGEPDFALVESDQDELAVVDASGAVTPVTALGAEPYGAFAVLDSDRIVFVTNGYVGTVSADGSVRKAPCPGCRGVAVTPAGVVTVADDFQPGHGFDIVRLDDDLKVVSRAPAARIAERPSASGALEDVEPPTLLGATRSTAYVGYLSRNGGVRQGPLVVAAYSLEGRLERSDVVGGTLYGSGLSPDGRYLALSVGGNFGACQTYATLAVLDTRTMTPLDTEPPLPASYAVRVGASNGLFRGLRLIWAGSPDRPEVLDAGTVHVPGNSDGCDQPFELYVRHFDITQQQFSDSGPLDLAQVGWFGGSGCDLGLYLDQPAPSPHLVVRGGQGDVALPSHWTTVAAAALPPSECPA